MSVFKRVKVLKQVLEVYDVPLTEQINEDFFKTHSPSISITDNIQVLSVMEFKEIHSTKSVARPKTKKGSKKLGKNNS